MGADRDSHPDWTEDQGTDRQPPGPPPISPSVRAPLDHAYTASELMAAQPRSEAVDVAALPAELRRKARAHHDDLDNIIESQQLTARRPRDVAWAAVTRVHRIIAPLLKYGIPLGVGATAVTMALHWRRHPGATTIEIVTAPGSVGYLTVGLVAIALVAWIAGRRGAAAPTWVYTDDELATLDAASLDWPAVPEELDRYANATTLRREWHGTWMSRIQPGGAALVWREPHLVAVATLLGRDIETSRTWNSELLDVHRVRIDLDQTLDDVYVRAHRIWRARANLVTPASTNTDDVVARRNAEINDAAADAWNTLVALVRQLQDYRKALIPVDAIHAEIVALQQSSLRITDAAVRQLHVDAAGNSLHADTVDAAAGELADLNANLVARLATLRHGLTAATNGLVLRAP